MTDPADGGDVVAGRYVLVDPIGSGGTGTVWRAWDRQLARWCAAKVMRQRHAGELLRFAREQSVRLTHPHVASPYAWAADDGTVLIASELVDGGSLHTLVGDYGAIDEATVVVVLDQVLSGLSAVHAAGLVHRDVKPGNVLLRATGDGPLHAMVTDFGLAIRADDARLTRSGTVIGTPGYLPPEVLTGLASPSPRQDVYAAGRLAVALLLGDEEPDDEAERAASTATPGAAPAVDNRLERIDDPRLRAVARAMVEPDPARRPADAAAARRLLAGLPRSARPRTADGDPVTVFDQLPPLETSGATPRVAGRRTLERPSDTRDATVSRGGGRRTRLAALALTIVSVAAAGAAIAVAQGDASERPGRPGQTSTGPVGTDPDTGPTADTGTVPSTGPTTSQTSRTITSGDVCGWQQQGDAVETAAGRLTCRLEGGAYVWGPSGG